MVDSDKKRIKTADEYLQELELIVLNLGEDNSKKKILVKFLKSKRKSRGMIDHYLSFHNMGVGLFSITIIGHDPFIARTLKHLIVDDSKEALEYIQSVR